MDRQCTVGGCSRPLKTGEWCQAHYMRWWETGDVRADEPLRPYRASAAELFWRKVDKGNTTDCWPWTGSVSARGYGKANYKGIWVSPHRFSYELAKGPIPEGLTIDHLCRNKACVNPAHLEAVTNGENMRRRNALVTHCKRGHEFTPENTDRHSTSGARVCRACVEVRKEAAKLLKRQ